jgi:hypothetical protein
MKKITIWSITFSAIMLGLFTLLTETKAQEESKDGTRSTDKNPVASTPGGDMTFSYFSSTNCFFDNDELIGRDVEFKFKGVTINAGLIKLSKSTLEFNTGFAKGKLLLNKVELSCPNSIFNDSRFKYTADKIEKSEGMILLNGHARITYTESNVIETDEIVISTF